MTGRHRRTTMSSARRALAAGVPALGLVGAVTAFTGAEPGTANVAEASGAASETMSAPPVTTAVPTPVTAPAVTTVAADAARAAGRAGELQRQEERRELHAVVADVRADAQERRESAAALGQEELAAFERDQQRQQEEATAERQPAPVDTDRGDADRGTSCDTSGPVTFGERADADEIVDRDCGLTDLFGRQRSSDSWIDGQLLSALGE